MFGGVEEIRRKLKGEYIISTLGESKAKNNRNRDFRVLKSQASYSLILKMVFCIKQIDTIGSIMILRRSGDAQLEQTLLVAFLALCKRQLARSRSSSTVFPSSGK